MTDTTILSAADLVLIDGEPRIADLCLAEALGFQNPLMIRKLIERHIEALQRFGGVFSTVEKTSPRGGRPGTSYHLSHRQALYLCTKSETENATEATISMVEAFAAWREDRLSPAAPGREVAPPPAEPDLPFWSQPLYDDRPVTSPSVVKFATRLVAVDLHHAPLVGDWCVFAVERNILDGDGLSSRILEKVSDVRIGRYVGDTLGVSDPGMVRCRFVHIPGEPLVEGETVKGKLIGRVVTPEMIGGETATAGGSAPRPGSLHGLASALNQRPKEEPTKLAAPALRLVRAAP